MSIQIMASDTGGGDFQPVPSGSHIARCVSVIDLGTHHNEMFGVDRHQVLIQWEIPDETIETDDGERPMVIGKFYTLSLSEKANLRKDLESWRGREFSADELQAFDVAKLAGAPAMLSVVHKTKKNGSIRAEVSGVSKLPKGTNCPPQVHDTTLFSISQASEESLTSLSDGIANMIRRSQEWTDHKVVDAVAETTEEFDDDIPF